MSVIALGTELTPEYTPMVTSDDTMLMALPPCCRGGGCANMTGSMSSSSTMGRHFHETTSVEQAADSIGLSRHTQAALDLRFTREFGQRKARAIFATFVAELLVEPPAQRLSDVAAINQEYRDNA